MPPSQHARCLVRPDLRGARSRYSLALTSSGRRGGQRSGRVRGTGETRWCVAARAPVPAPQRLPRAVWSGQTPRRSQHPLPGRWRRAIVPTARCCRAVSDELDFGAKKKKKKSKKADEAQDDGAGVVEGEAEDDELNLDLVRMREMEQSPPPLRLRHDSGGKWRQGAGATRKIRLARITCRAPCRPAAPAWRCPPRR